MSGEGIATIVGDSQGVGMLGVLGPVLARHGLQLDTAKSWAQQGAGIDAVTERAVHAGPAAMTLVFSGGGNDSARLVNDPDAYRQKLETLVGTLRFAGVQDVVLVGPFVSLDPAVQAQHEAARAVQARGIRGARWIDGFRLSEWTAHPPGNLTHWDRVGYASIGLELERAVFSSGTVTAIGLVGTLTFIGGMGILLMEALYTNASEP